MKRCNLDNITKLERDKEEVFDILKNNQIPCINFPCEDAGEDYGNCLNCYGSEIYWDRLSIEKIVEYQLKQKK